MQPSLRISDSNTFRITLPPLSEQVQIVEFIENQLATIREAQTRIEGEIVLARELYQTLVAEGVTGQFDVSDAPLDDMADFNDQIAQVEHDPEFEEEFADVEDELALMEDDV